MKKIISTYLLLFATLTQAQIHSVQHTVAKGETLTQIAKRYGISVQSILLINPGAAEKVLENQILLIPNSSKIEHKVQPKETLYGISKQYNVAIERLYEMNEGLRENGLKEGQLLIISKGENAVVSLNLVDKNTKKYEVKAGDTIYSIAVNNGISVSEIYEFNPGLQNSVLQAGQLLVLPVRATNTIVKEEINTSQYFEIKVQPKETLYNICKTYGITEQQLLEWNPQLKEGLKEGTTVKILQKKTSNTHEPQISKSKEISRPKFEMFRAEGAKELVLLMPFDIENNDPNSSAIYKKLSENVFLNMAIDFYSGTSIAIEEIALQNLPLTIRVIDSEETNRNLDINELKSKFDFSKTDVVIGPFYQKNVDAMSKAFQGKKTLIVSPLSTEKGEPYPNQVHTMPNESLLKTEMMEYLKSQKGNIVSVIHSSDKKNNAKYYQDKENIQQIETNNKGNVTKEIIKNKLSTTEKNYVILDTKNHTTTIELVNVLKELQKKYNIQLVVLERGQNLDSTDVSIEDLAQLKMLFPSVTNESKTQKREYFAEEYRKKYGINPSKYAVRGYDVMLDIVNRMYSGAEGNIFEYGSQQVENKFTYIDNYGGIYNNGVFILEYQKDLTIKEAK